MMGKKRMNSLVRLFEAVQRTDGTYQEIGRFVYDDPQGLELGPRVDLGEALAGLTSQGALQFENKRFTITQRGKNRMAELREALNSPSSMIP